MENGSSENKAFWMPICRDIGCAILACAMWTGTFYMVFGGNENHVLSKEHAVVSINDLQGLAALFH